MNEHFWWYVARASGVVAWGLLTAGVIMGLWVSMRLTRSRPRPAWTLDVHRFLGALAVIFLGVHLLGLVADSYVEFGVKEVLVPFASTWQPTAVAWGVIACYLLLAIELTSLAMRRLPRKLWRGIHLTSYALFVLATVHMFTAGTDAGRWPVQWLGLGGVSVVAFLTLTRVLRAGDREPTAVAARRERTERAERGIAA
ncbi:MAG: ferric reductase-like transmembrane domain-containing protein [Acidimicrobiia bacterium]